MTRADIAQIAQFLMIVLASYQFYKWHGNVFAGGWMFSFMLFFWILFLNIGKP